MKTCQVCSGKITMKEKYVKDKTNYICEDCSKKGWTFQRIGKDYKQIIIKNIIDDNEPDLTCIKYFEKI